MRKKTSAGEVPLRDFQVLIKHPNPMGRPFMTIWLDIRAKNRKDAKEQADSVARSYSGGGWIVIKVREVTAAAPPPVNSQILRQLNPSLDVANLAILEQRATQVHATVSGPGAGDFVVLPNGELLRLTHEGGDFIPATSNAASNSDFYLGTYQVSFSGPPASYVQRLKLLATSETRAGEFWFFRDDIARADNIMPVNVPCRTWRLRA